MANSLILNLPVKLGLELMAVIGANGVNPERKLLHDVIDEIDRIRLCVAGVNFQGPDSGGIVDGCVLEPLNSFSCVTDKFQELDIDLDVVSRSLFFVSQRRDSSNGSVPRQAIHSVPPEDIINATRGDLDVMVALQVPDDPLRTEMVLSPQVQDLFLNGMGYSAGQVIPGSSLTADQPQLTGDLVGPFPLVKRVARDPEISAGLRNVLRLDGVVQDLEFSINFALNFRNAHSRPPGGKESYLTCQAYS